MFYILTTTSHTNNICLHYMLRVIWNHSEDMRSRLMLNVSMYDIYVSDVRQDIDNCMGVGRRLMISTQKVMITHAVTAMFTRMIMILITVVSVDADFKEC